MYSFHHTRNIFIPITICLLFFVWACSGNRHQEANYKSLSDSVHVRRMNAIILDNNLQLPYIHHTFMNDQNLIMHERAPVLTAQKESVWHQHRMADKQFVFSAGDIIYKDTLTHKSRPSVLIEDEKDSYNKEVSSFSRPYVLSDDEVVVFFMATFLVKTGDMVGPVYGKIWAVKYFFKDGRWEENGTYSIADIA